MQLKYVAFWITTVQCCVCTDVCLNVTCRINTTGMTHIKIKKSHCAGMAFRDLYVVNITYIYVSVCVCLCLCVCVRARAHARFTYNRTTQNTFNVSSIWPNWSQYKPYQYETQMCRALAVK